MAAARAKGSGHQTPGAVLAALTRLLAIIGGFLMLGTAVTVCISVLLRWLASSAVPGDIELVQVSTAVAVFCFLPLCQWQRGNIMVDTFTTWLPLRTQRGLDALWDALYAVSAGIIAWRLAFGAYDTIRSNTVSMMLGLPIGWAIAACAAMAALLGLVAIMTASVLLRKPR
jgi:TRAP-type C4-dicarboxylate transport system permease small subunit